MRRSAFLLSFLILAAGLTACTDTPEPEAAAPPAEATEAPEATLEDGVQVVRITAGADGFQPEQIVLQADIPARLIFTREVESPCLEQVQIPAFGIARTDLPLGEPVTIEFTPQEQGTFRYICGMEMQHGTLLVTS